MTTALKAYQMGATTVVTGATANRWFVPGTLLVERYRIVAQVGKGGMGEVCRADDPFATAGNQDSDWTRIDVYAYVGSRSWP